MTFGPNESTQLISLDGAYHQASNSRDTNRNPSTGCILLDGGVDIVFRQIFLIYLEHSSTSLANTAPRGCLYNPTATSTSDFCRSWNYCCEPYTRRMGGRTMDAIRVSVEDVCPYKIIELPQVNKQLHLPARPCLRSYQVSRTT